MTVNDYEGFPIEKGATVVAWWDGKYFTATVKEIEPTCPGLKKRNRADE